MASTRPETSRSAQLLVPYLSMPLVIGSLWIALAPHGLVALAVLTAGSAALACYMLGAVIAGLQVSRDLALRRAVARLQPGVIGRIRACAQGNAWCEVQVGEYRGWLKRAEMFGVTADEVIGG